MTKITIFQRDNEVVGFESKGHSGYAEAGSDIICSAVSVLILNTLNSLEQLTDVDFEGSVDEENAVIECMITDKNSIESLVLFNSLVLGLTMLAEDNPKFVSITFKEV